MTKSLVIVESPAKSKTIEKYLGADFKVVASYGHVRDLPSKEGSVDTADNFAMKYTWIERNINHIESIVRLARQADVIYLATDLDREGEAISWHIAEILREKGLQQKTMHRITFSEITQKALKEAVSHPRELLMPLVDAQQARRALDYLVGFNLSPVLWKKLQKGLSAGRVQSPALRLIVEREEAIEAFKPVEYWSIEAELLKDGIMFNAKLSRYQGQKLQQFTLANESSATEVKNVLAREAAAIGGRLPISDVLSKPKQRRPAPPFTTSTLQQEASRKLGFSAKQTMQVAQALYEGIAINGEQVGLITYMRTDSVNLSEDMVSELRSWIIRTYGSRFIPAHPVLYVAKTKNAQEAHEAIRPTSWEREPEKIKAQLDIYQFKLYELIWQRTVACQMSNAELLTTTVLAEIPAVEAEFRASGTVVEFPGFLRVYEEGVDKKADEDDKRALPAMAIGDKVKLHELNSDQHFTEPSPRFNEATLVKTLEEFGIGRPSTYAAIIQVLLNRMYVTLENKRFQPTDIGRAVSHFLTQHFEHYVDYQFTAALEDQLDAISRGEVSWLKVMSDFWQPFNAAVKNGMEASRDEAHGARLLGSDPVSGKPVGARLGRYGPVVYRGDPADKAVKLEFASLESEQSLATITLEEALKLFEWPKQLGTHEGVPVTVNKGLYGAFVSMDKLKATLPKEIDPKNVTLEKAVEILLAHKEARERYVLADLGNGYRVLNGKFGPYVTNGKGRNATLPKDTVIESLTMADIDKILEDYEAAKKDSKKQWPRKNGSGKPWGQKNGDGKRNEFNKRSEKSFAGSRPSKHDDLPM